MKVPAYKLFPEFKPEDPDYLLVAVESPELVGTLGLVDSQVVDLPAEVAFEADARSVVGKLDYPNNDIGWPIFSKRALDVLGGVRDFGRRLVPVVIIDRKTRKQTKGAFFAVLLDQELVGALDHEKCVFETMPDFPDRIVGIDEWAFIEPQGGFPPLFRVVEHRGHLFVSPAAKTALVRAKVASGMRFIPPEEII